MWPAIGTENSTLGGCHAPRQPTCLILLVDLWYCLATPNLLMTPHQPLPLEIPSTSMNSPAPSMSLGFISLPSHFSMNANLLSGSVPPMGSSNLIGCLIPIFSVDGSAYASAATSVHSLTFFFASPRSV